MAKSSYDQEIINRSQNDTKGTRTTINEILNRTKIFKKYNNNKQKTNFKQIPFFHNLVGYDI